MAGIAVDISYEQAIEWVRDNPALFDNAINELLSDLSIKADFSLYELIILVREMLAERGFQI